jgi:hypothetical protein
VIRLSIWLAAVARLAGQQLRRARYAVSPLFRPDIGIGLLVLIGAGVSIAAVPIDTPNITYIWAGCITFLLGVLVERAIQTAASRYRNSEETTTVGGEPAAAAPSGTGPVIDAEYTIVAATTDVIEPPRSVREARLRIKATIEISSLAVVAILLWLLPGPPVSANLRTADRADLGYGATSTGGEPQRHALSATDGRATDEAIEPFPGARLRDGLWLAMEDYFDGAHSFDSISSLFERRGGGSDLQMRFMSYQDLLRAGGSLRDELFAQHRATGRSAVAARSTAAAWIKFRGPCWKHYAQWPDGRRMEPWDIYDAAPGAGAEKNPWRAEIRQKVVLCQAALASLGTPAPARQ